MAGSSDGEDEDSVGALSDGVTMLHGGLVVAAPSSSSHSPPNAKKRQESGYSSSSHGSASKKQRQSRSSSPSSRGSGAEASQQHRDGLVNGFSENNSSLFGSDAGDDDDDDDEHSVGSNAANHVPDKAATRVNGHTWSMQGEMSSQGNNEQSSQSKYAKGNPQDRFEHVYANVDYAHTAKTPNSTTATSSKLPDQSDGSPSRSDTSSRESSKDRQTSTEAGQSTQIDSGRVSQADVTEARSTDVADTPEPAQGLVDNSSASIPFSSIHGTGQHAARPPSPGRRVSPTRIGSLAQIPEEDVDNCGGQESAHSAPQSTSAEGQMQRTSSKGDLHTVQRADNPSNPVNTSDAQGTSLDASIPPALKQVSSPRELQMPLISNPLTDKPIGKSPDAIGQHLQAQEIRKHIYALQVPNILLINAELIRACLALQEFYAKQYAGQKYTLGDDYTE
ncbi:hypothetical protein EMMF5_001785 [Cystobasidiomycetes sp. EMM_F5]